MNPDAPASAQRYPNPGQAVLLIFIAVGLQIATGATAFTINYLASGDIKNAEDQLWNAWILLPFTLISGSLTLAIGLRASHESAAHFFRVRPFPPILLGPVFLTAVGLAIVLSETDNCIVDLVLSITGSDKPVADLFDMSLNPVGAAIVAIIAAPFFEEFLFRGMILRGLLTHCRRPLAIGATAVAFGAVHGNVRQFFLAVVIGTVFGWWYARTRSVGPGMIGHALFNAVAWGSAQLPDLAHAVGLHTAESRGLHSPWWFTTGGVAFTALGIWAFHRQAPDVEPDLAPSVWSTGTAVPLAEPPLLVEPPLLDQPPLLDPAND